MSSASSPIYNPGDKVKLRGSTGTIIECININDRRDAARQGFRYYVLVAGITWSASERELG